MILFVINIWSCIALFLLIFFRTNAWLEYCRMFHLNFPSFYKDFDEKYKKDFSLTYIDYLRRYHNCFFVRLITCPICFSVWLGILLGIITTSIILIPLYSVGGLLTYVIIDRLLG